MKVSFFGAAGEVTGSCHLVEAAGKRILLDCGMIQGGRDEARRNTEKFAFDTRRIDSMVLSHAHIDHVGRLPLLRKRGYKGDIHTQFATRSLSRIMLEDSCRLAAQDVAYENRRRERRGLRPIDPLYDDDDVREVLHQLRGHAYDEWFEVEDNIKVRLRDAGHIIGAAIVELHAVEDGVTKKLVFSGDIGPKGTPILRDASVVKEADLLLLESTYGDRLHRARTDTIAELGEIFEDVHATGGIVLIPAFSVGRTQEILYWFAQNFHEWGLDRMKIAIDSPMADKVTQLYDDHQDLFDEEAKRLWRQRISPFRLPNLRFIQSIQDSQAINNIKGGQIIIAGSGMCNGGRIRHHLKHHLWRPSTHVIFPGFQAHGTLGRELVDGAKHVNILGERVRVAAKLHTVGGLSAHADQAGLMEWYSHFEGRPPVWLVHGEDKAREVLAAQLREVFGATVELARPGATAEF